MGKQVITIFGGSGFVGRHLVRTLAQEGARIRVAVRRPSRASHLLPLGDVGQIVPIRSSILDEKSVESAISGADQVINLVGIISEKGAQTFESIHVESAQRIAKMASKAGVSSLIHVSAIGANRDSPSRYARSKAFGEAAITDYFSGATILRPSIIFGAGDSSFTRIAAMVRYSPALPLFFDSIFQASKTRFQPVFVGDIAAAISRCLGDPKTRGQSYELGGPVVYSYREVVETILNVIGRRRFFVPVHFVPLYNICIPSRHMPLLVGLIKIEDILEL